MVDDHLRGCYSNYSSIEKQRALVYRVSNNAAETMGAINSEGITFLDDLGRRITQVTDDNCKKAFLYQRLSVLIIFAHTTPEDEF